MPRRLSPGTYAAYSQHPPNPRCRSQSSEQIALPAPIYRSEQGLLAPRTRQRYQQVQELLAQGATIRAIARELDLARGTVRRFARASSVHELLAKPHPGRPRVLDEHADYLRERLASGVTNAVTLCAELRERGYRGSTTTLRAYLRPLRAAVGRPPASRRPPRPASWPAGCSPTRTGSPTTTATNSHEPGPPARISTPWPPMSRHSPRS
jgi:transposase